MRVSWLIALCLCLPTLSRASELEPFATDGCSLWFDGTLEQPNLWRHCCVAHDFDYWQGGSKALRQKSDETLQACVEEAQGISMADYIYTNVRWGGSPYWINYYRWGYGWSYLDGLWPRGYKEPSVEERQLIEHALPAALQLIADDAIKHPAKAPADKTGGQDE